MFNGDGGAVCFGRVDEAVDADGGAADKSGQVGVGGEECSLVGAILEVGLLGLLLLAKESRLGVECSGGVGVGWGGVGGGRFAIVGVGLGLVELLEEGG